MKRVWTMILFFGFMMCTLCGCGSDMQDVGQKENEQQAVSDTDTEYKREIRYHEDGRIILTYSVFDLGPRQKSLINSFNAQDEEYYIEIQDFGKGHENDPMKAYEDFDLALVNGVAGDILQVDSSFYTKYLRLGAYEDLNPYMEADEEFDKSDYWENIMTVCEVDGKLYYMPINFEVKAYFGRVSVWEGRENLTIDETIELLNSLPEGQELLFRMTRKEFITEIMNTGADNFVDWESGECNFESEEFQDVLRVANNLPEEYVSDGNSVDLGVKLGSGEVLLAELVFSDYRIIQDYKAYMGEDIVMVNYPGSTNEGNVLMLLSQNTYAINADSLSKDGAWEFIKFVLSEEQQNAMEQGKFQSGQWYIPMNKAIFEKQMQKWQTPNYIIDENGEKVESPYTLFVSEDIQFEIYHATDEDVALWTQVIENVTSVQENNYVLTNIIMEEAGPYFDGQKSVDEVAEIIQGRISIYVNENM